MKNLFTIFVFAFSILAFAHDEGHGPKLTDAAKFGGVLAPVIDAKESKLGAKAALVYKAELVRSEDGTVRVYFYDKEINPLDLTRLSATADAVVEFKKNKKWTTTPFNLKQEEGAFVGKAPRVSKKPFNIDVTVTEGKRRLLTAFDNLD